MFRTTLYLAWTACVALALKSSMAAASGPESIPDKTSMAKLVRDKTLMASIVGVAQGETGPAPKLAIYPSATLDARQLPRLERFFSEHSNYWEIRWDERTDRPHLIQGVGVSLFEASLGRWHALRRSEVEKRLRRFLADYPELFRISPAELRLDPTRSSIRGTGFWRIEFNQHYEGLPVVGATIFMHLSQGRLTQFGSRGLADIDLDSTPRLSCREALKHASSLAEDRQSSLERSSFKLLSCDGLAIFPTLSSNEEPGEIDPGVQESGLEHRLGWRLTVRLGDRTFELVIDAHHGNLLKSRDLIHSAERQAMGEVAAVRRDLPTLPLPFPWLRIFASDVTYTSADGFYDYLGGTAWTRLDGLYVTTIDGCGAFQFESDDGHFDLGSGGGDCQTPGFGGPGNTLAARTAFYYLSRAQERASTHAALPGLRNDPLIVRTNLPGDGCGAYYNADLGTLDFERSASGCTNPGELPGLLLHEWGHAILDGTGRRFSDGASSEAAADILAALETGESCIGHGFRPGVACRNCSQSCTGVRDLSAFVLGSGNLLARPDTIEEDQGLDCDRLGCPYYAPGAEQYQGPMGYQAHCESQIASSATWDLSRRLVQAFGSERGGQRMKDLWYQSLVAAGSAYRKLPSMPSCQPALEAVDGCESDNWYTVLLAIDDDDGNLANGTPNACLIWQAFDTHGIACGDEPPCHCARTAVADAGPDREVCAGEPVYIGTPSRPGHTYYWSPIESPPNKSRDTDSPPTDGHPSQLRVTPTETTVYTLKATTDCGNASDQVTVTVSACDVPFDGDFEAGGIGWQTDGLWHLATASSCLAPGYASPIHAMYHGQYPSCHYDTGGASSGELISPWIEGITENSHLTFDFAREVEFGPFDRDRAEVAILTAGDSAWDPRWARDALDVSEGAWSSAGPISLAPYAGQPIKIRFRFDTRDGEVNNHLGWTIDDVQVVDLEPPTGNAEPEITLLDPLEGGLFEACTCVPVSALADDAENGDLSAIVLWSSDRDGRIGAGRSLAAALTVGDHILTASVTDPGGQTTSKTVQVTVEPTEGCDLSQWPPASPELFCGDDE